MASNINLSDINVFQSDDPYKGILERISSQRSLQMATIWLINWESRTVSAVARVGYEAPDHDEFEFVHTMDDSLIGKALSEIEFHDLRFFQVKNIADSPLFDLHRSKDRAKRLGLESLTMVPFWNHSSRYAAGRFSGILNIYTKLGDEIDPSEIIAIGDKLSDVQSSLFLLKKDRISDKILKVFDDPGILTNSDTLSKVIQQVCLPLIRTEACSIFEWNSHKSAYQLVATSDEISESRKSKTLDWVGAGLTGQVAKQNTPLVLHELTNVSAVRDQIESDISTEDILRDMEQLTSAPFSFLGVPIENPASLKKGQPMGVVRFINKKCVLSDTTNYFSLEDVELANEICRLLALHEDQNRQDANRHAFALQFGHEAKAPAIGVRGAAQRLDKMIQRGDASDGEKASILGDIEEFASLIISLSDTLIFGLADPGQSKSMLYNPRRAGLRRAIESAKKVVIPLCRSEKISFSNITITGSFPDLYIDPTALVQVFYNLFTNAIKYRQKDDNESFRVLVTCSKVTSYEIQSHLLRGTIRFDEHRNKPYTPVDGFLLDISDYGIGLDSDQTTKVFDHGYRVPGIGSIEIRGSGIGLPIVRRILNDFDSVIWVQKPRGPTNFRIFIPSDLENRSYLKSKVWKTN